MSTSYSVAVVGGGQAGLAAGYYLKRAKVDFVILDRNPRAGDSWRRRWSTLRLFTPARIDALPGLRFPAGPDENPTRDAMASYLEDYASRFDLPIRSGVTVRGLSRSGSGFELATDKGVITADQVIVATGANQAPKVPAWAADLDPAVRQLTAAGYSSPADLAAGDVFIVGAGNSGSEIALEAAAAGHRVTLAGRDTGQGNGKFFKEPFWWLGTHLLTTRTPMGRRMAVRMFAHGAPRFWLQSTDFEAAGIRRVPRVDSAAGVHGATVIWCTGFTQDFSWIDVPGFATAGRPLHKNGVSVVPGLYFLGLPFQRSVASTLVGGAKLDARFVVRKVARTRRLGTLPSDASPGGRGRGGQPAAAGR